MKPIEQTRREFLRAAGKGVLGAAALTAIPSVLKPALAETAASPAYPWTYQQVDKDAVLKHTYDCFLIQNLHAIHFDKPTQRGV